MSMSPVVETQGKHTINMRLATSLRQIWQPRKGVANPYNFKIIRKHVPTKTMQKLVRKIVISFDTFFLVLRVMMRRMKKLGIKGLWIKLKFSDDRCLYYFDIGTHADANELRWVSSEVLPKFHDHYQAYGFEASKKFFPHAVDATSGIPNVHMENYALTSLDQSGATLKLYENGLDGGGTSLYRKSDIYEELDAISFSQWLEKKSLDLDGHPCLIRMNVEGAEFDIIKDIVDSGQKDKINGYYGSWDDVRKISKSKGEEFEEYLRTHRIRPLRFEGMVDLSSRVRRRAIVYDMKTSLHCQE